MPLLSISKTYADGDVLFEADIDNIRSDVETFLNVTKIDSDNIQDSGVEAAKLATNAVTTTKILDANVTTDKIADSNVTKAKLAADALAFLVPTGAVLPYAAASSPTGFLLCDGTAVDRTTYADLFAIIGINHGEGDGATTFNLPDYRGRFLRGVDNGAGRDPNAGTRTAMGTNGNTGDNVGSIQGTATEAHTHTAPSHTHTPGNFVAEMELDGTTIKWDKRSSGVASWSADTRWTGSGISESGSSGSYTTGIDIGGTSDAGGGTATSGMTSITGESRPVNAYVEYIIKI